MILKEPVIRERVRVVKGRKYSDFQAYCGRVNGKKLSLFANTAEEAAARGEAFIARYKSSDGPILASLSRRQVLDALNALEILAAAGANLQSASLSALAAEFVGRYGAVGEVGCGGVENAPTLGNLADRFLASIDPSRERHYNTHKSILSRLRKTVPPETPARSLSRAHFERFLAPYTEPVTRNSQLSRLKSFANWCVKNRLIASSPLEGIAPSAVVYKEPAFFVPSKVERIMRVAEREADEARGADEKRLAVSAGMFLTLGFFAGIRTSEIFRARWDDINLDEGFVRIPRPKGATNGARPRIVELEPNVVAWIRAFSEKKAAMSATA